LRLTRSIVPIAAVAVLAAGNVVVSADPGGPEVSASEHLVTAIEQPHAVRPRTIFPVVDPQATVVDPTPSFVRPPTARPVVVLTTSPVGPNALRPVNLGTVGSFAILTKSGITDVSASRITGNVGASPNTT